MSLLTDIAGQLKQQTLQEHRLTEQLLDVGRVMTGEFSEQDYFRLLETNYLVWAGFLAVWKQRVPDLWPEYRALAEKLAAAAAEEIRQADRMLPLIIGKYPVPETRAALMGSVYVHFGSLLGGKVIWQSLNRAEGLQRHQPFRFYAAGGDFAGGEWRGLLQGLAEQLNNEEQVEQAVEQAKKVFAYYREVFLR